MSKKILKITLLSILVLLLTGLGAASVFGARFKYDRAFLNNEGGESYYLFSDSSWAFFNVDGLLNGNLEGNLEEGVLIQFGDYSAWIYSWDGGDVITAEYSFGESYDFYSTPLEEINAPAEIMEQITYPEEEEKEESFTLPAHVETEKGEAPSESFPLIPIICGAAILAAGLVILIIFESRWKHYALEHSSAIEKLKDLNKRYGFNYELCPNYDIAERVDSKAKFDGYNSARKLREQFSINTAFWKGLFDWAEYNSSNWADYVGKAETIKGQADMTGIYRSKEKQLLKKLTYKKPPMGFSVTYSIYYSSPQGKKNYSREELLAYEDVLQEYALFRREQERHATAQYQRSLMNSSLRYDVMKRDGFRCVICGRTQEDGIKLHVDHIVPISRGGRTEMGNLRTLCEDCNLGKRDKYDYFGLN